MDCGLRTTRWSLSRKSVRTPGHHCAKQRTKNPCKTCLKIHQKQSQRHKNHPKATQKHQKSRCGGVRGALGRGLGAMRVPRGAQKPQNVRKARSSATLGPPFGRSFSVLFRLFRCFFGALFRRVVWDGFRDRFRVDFGVFWEGFFEDFCIIFCVPCTLENIILIWYLQCLLHISVSENLKKIRKSASSEALFSETRPRPILEPFLE